MYCQCRSVHSRVSHRAAIAPQTTSTPRTKPGSMRGVVFRSSDWIEAGDIGPHGCSGATSLRGLDRELQQSLPTEAITRTGRVTAAQSNRQDRQAGRATPPPPPSSPEDAHWPTRGERPKLSFEPFSPSLPLSLSLSLSLSRGLADRRGHRQSSFVDFGSAAWRGS